MNPPERPWLIRTLLKLPPIRFGARLIYELFVDRIDRLGDRVRALEDHAYVEAQSSEALLEANVELARQVRGIHKLTVQVLDLASERSAELKALSEGPQTAGGRVYVKTSDYSLLNPEAALMASLYAHLPARVAVDVGAHAGEVSQALVDAGYEVHAFEPFPASFTDLEQRLGARHGFFAHRLAVSARDQPVTLHLAEAAPGADDYPDASLFHSLTEHSLPEGLSFAGSVEVQARSLDSLHRDRTLPEAVSLVKIDTEGFDLEVIRGMGERRYAVVTAEFWDSETPFGRRGAANRLEDLVAEMRSRGYHWHIVMHRTWGEYDVSFYAVHPRSLPRTWGNVVFFSDHDVFREAHEWCSAVLPKTLFVPPEAPG